MNSDNDGDDDDDDKCISESGNSSSCKNGTDTRSVQGMA